MPSHRKIGINILLETIELKLDKIQIHFKKHNLHALCDMFNNLQIYLRM